jgi:hypothetical protein
VAGNPTYWEQRFAYQSARNSARKYEASITEPLDLLAMALNYQPIARLELKVEGPLNTIRDEGATSFQTQVILAKKVISCIANVACGYTHREVTNSRINDLNLKAATIGERLLQKYGVKTALRLSGYREHAIRDYDFRGVAGVQVDFAGDF